MSQESFKPGDTVQLNSGGPLMTVDHFESDTGQYCCSWFDKNQRRHDFFGPETLRKVDAMSNDAPFIV